MGGGNLHNAQSLRNTRRQAGAGRLPLLLSCGKGFFGERGKRGKGIVTGSLLVRTTTRIFTVENVSMLRSLGQKDVLLLRLAVLGVYVDVNAVYVCMHETCDLKCLQSVSQDASCKSEIFFSTTSIHTSN